MNLIESFVGVIGREHELPKTGAVGSSPVDPRRPVIDGLLPSAAGSSDTLKVGGQEVRVELLVELEIEDISQWRSGSNVGKCSVRVPLEDLCKIAARIGTTVGGNGELQRATSRVGRCRVDLRKHALPVLDYRRGIAGTDTAASNGVYGLYCKTFVTHSSGRPVIKETARAVKAEATEYAGLSTLIRKAGVL